MYSHPQDDAVGPPGAAEAPDQLESVAPAAGGGATEAHVSALAAGRRQSHVSSLLAEIARAMQAAAAQERERIHAGVAEEEAFQIEKVRTRATAKSAALRKGADDDVRNVQSWCEEQIRQIRLEAERRVDERRRELEQSVTQHGALIETEEQSVHGAVQGYRDTLDAFFARMAEEGDPSAIAGLAGTLPDPPDLDVVRADARSRAMRALEAEEASDQVDPPAGDEPPSGDGPTVPDGTIPPSVEELVPVMDPEAVSEPAPVMDPTAGVSPHQSAAVRVIRSFASRTPPPHIQQ